MEKREKTEFILDQMRLESQRANWVRVRVGGRKINRAYLKEDGNADLKLRYYELIIQLALEEDAFLDACKAYQQVYDTAEVKDDPARAQQVLESITYFIVLAPHDNEQSDMIHKLALKPEIEKLALHQSVGQSQRQESFLSARVTDSSLSPTFTPISSHPSSPAAISSRASRSRS